jgi:hypothetical protein
MSSSCISTICSRSMESLRLAAASHSRPGCDYRAMGSSGGTDSQNEVLSKAGAAVIKKASGAEQMIEQQAGSSTGYLSNLPASQ